MKTRNLLYIAIITICIIAIILAVYYQMFDKKVVKESALNIVENTIEEEEEEIDPKDTLAEFNKLFTNEFYSQDYSTDNIVKYDGLEDYEIVYTLNDGIKDKKEDQYDVDVSLPVINIVKAAKLNETTQTIFADKTTNILAGTNKYTIYNVEYVAYLNDNILSVVIKSTLKEGNSAQRVIVQTYNYDIEADKEVTLNEVLNEYGYKTNDVNKKIEKQVKEASKQAKTIAEATGQIIYTRDINNSMYATDNSKYFFIGKDGQIYIVYPYGNNNVTSELDVIKI